MRSLSETQALFRDAIAGGSGSALLQTLRAPADAAGRLEIYRRHYREGFRRHLRGRYPTVEWLLGTAQLVQLADLTLQQCPPRAPSLAEYGAELIAAIRSTSTGLPPYIADVARLDWCLGSISVAVEHVPVALATLSAIDPRCLPQLRVTLQPGLAYLASGWPVDELVHLRLQESQPDEFAFTPRWTWLQLRGARGAFTLTRLAPGDFAFRSSLASGGTLADAALLGSQAEPDFNLSTALASLFAEGLVISHSGEDAHV